MLLDNGKQGLHECTYHKESCNCKRNRGPRVLEIVAHKHRSILWPTSFAIIIDLIGKFEIVIRFDISVGVKFVEELGGFLYIQPVFQDSILRKYLYIVFGVDEIVQENSVRGDHRLITRATLLQADEVSK